MDIIMASGTSSSSATSSVSTTSDEDHDGDVLMTNNTITVSINEWHKTYMKACCSEGTCFANFKYLEDRILDADPEPLFGFVHENDNGCVVTSTPMSKKWSEFLFDVFNWKTHELFERNYVTELDVNRQGKGKIYAAWHVLDQYRGRYRSKNLTHNVVDIKVHIPDANLIISEHFCFKYFRRSKGSPYTLVPDVLKSTLSSLYDRYFDDFNNFDVVSRRIHFTCAYCSHEEEEGPEDKHIRCIPKWYLKELYQNTTRVSTYELSFTILALLLHSFLL